MNVTGQSAWVTCRTLDDIIVQPPTEPPEAIEVTTSPLIGGFAVRLTPDALGWYRGYGISAVFVRYRRQGAQQEWTVKNVANIHPRTNFLVQKTVLGLERGKIYDVQCYASTEDMSGPIFFESSAILTLNAGAPIPPRT